MGLSRLQCIFLLAAMLWGISASAEPLKSPILVIHSRDSDESRSFIEGMRSTYPGIVKSLLTDKIESCPESLLVVVAFGMSLADSLLQKCSGMHVQVVETEENIKKLYEKHGTTFGGVVLEQSYLAQMKAIEKRIPSLRRIGFLYTRVEEKEEIERLAGKTKITIVPVQVPEGESAGIYFRSLIREVDAIMVTSNSTIWSPKDIKGYLLTSIRQGKMLVGGVREDYIKAGILAGTFTDMQVYGGKLGTLLSENFKRVGTVYPPVGNFRYNNLLASRMSLHVIE